jgi:hypothetical protein
MQMPEVDDLNPPIFDADFVQRDSRDSNCCICIHHAILLFCVAFRFRPVLLSEFAGASAAHVAGVHVGPRASIVLQESIN